LNITNLHGELKKKRRKIVPSTRTTRSSSKHYLIGESYESIQGVKPPTNKQIFSLFTWSKQKWLLWKSGFFPTNQSFLNIF